MSGIRADCLPPWISGLSEWQRLDMIIELVQFTFLSDLRFLNEIIKSREAALIAPSPLFTSAIGVETYDEQRALKFTSTKATPEEEVSLNSRPLSRNYISSSIPQFPLGNYNRRHYSQSPSSYAISGGVIISKSPERPYIATDTDGKLPPTQLNHRRIISTSKSTASTTQPSRTTRSKKKFSKYPIEETGAFAPSAILNWLHVLRLHKYAANLQVLTPRELLDLDEEALKNRGVDTVGARKKLLLAFRDAKESLGIPV